MSSEIANACQVFVQGPQGGQDPNQTPGDYAHVTRASVRMMPLVSDFVISRFEAGDISPYKVLAPCAWTELKRIVEIMTHSRRFRRLDR